MRPSIGKDAVDSTARKCHTSKPAGLPRLHGGELLTPDGRRPRLCVSHDPGRKRRPEVERPHSEAAFTPSEAAARPSTPSELATVTTAQAASLQRGRAPTAEELGSRRIDSFFASGANPREQAATGAASSVERRHGRSKAGLREAGGEAAMVPGVRAASAGRWLGEEEREGNARRLENEAISQAVLQAARPRVRRPWIGACAL